MTKKTIETLFVRYVNLILREFDPKSQSSFSNNIVQLISNPIKEMCEKIDKIENSSQFQELVDGSYNYYSGSFHSKNKDHWKPLLKFYFRRSGLYIKIFKEEIIDLKYEFEKYINALEVEEITTSFLVPLEYVSFSKDFMDFDDFQIQTFSKEELSKIFQNRMKPELCSNVLRLAKSDLISLPRRCCPPKSPQSLQKDAILGTPSI